MEHYERKILSDNCPLITKDNIIYLTRFLCLRFFCQRKDGTVNHKKSILIMFAVYKYYGSTTRHLHFYIYFCYKFYQIFYNFTTKLLLYTHPTRECVDKRTTLVTITPAMESRTPIPSFPVRIDLIAQPNTF